VAAAGWTVLTKSLQPDSLLPMVAPLWARPLLAGDAVAFYVGKLALPVQCGPDYGRTPEWVMGQTIFYIAWLAPVALVAILAGLRNRRVWLTAAAIFVLWLLPVLGLAPFVFQRISTVADRYVYLSLLGPAVALAWLLRYRWNRWSVGMTSSGLCLLAALSTWQTTHWRDDEALCSYALWVNPSSVVAWNNRGYLLIQEGRYTEAVALYRRQLPEHPKPEHPKYAEFYLNLATAHVAMGQLDDALAVTLEAVEQLPNQPRLHCALAGVMVNKAAASPGDDAANWRDAAEQAYRDALELDPHLGEAHCQLGKLLWDSRRHEEALREYRLAVDGRRLPGDLPFRVEAHVNLGVAAGQAGRVDEARHHYLAAIDVLPDRPSAHYNLAMLLQKEGKTAEAEEHYRLTLRYEPSHLAAQVNLGILLFQQDRTKEAIEQFESALRSDPEMALAHFHLGEALASEGRTDEAAAAWRAAADYAEPDSPLAREARERLRDLGTQ
jgi:tetratricopeptide (TPR) repeat protein